jgi:hypothetical protein
MFGCLFVAGKTLPQLAASDLITLTSPGSKLTRNAGAPCKSGAPWRTSGLFLLIASRFRNNI